jgi:chromosome segregation ATPase
MMDRHSSGGKRNEEQEARLQQQEEQLREQEALLRGQREQMLLLDNQLHTSQATLSHQEAHITLLTERHTFLTTREAESQRQVIAAHEQLALRDADYRNLLANYERQRRDLSDAYRQLYEAQKQIADQSVQFMDMHTEMVEMSHYAEGLERTWEEKNAHIRQLEHNLASQSSRSLRGLVGRLARRVQSLGRS